MDHLPTEHDHLVLIADLLNSGDVAAARDAIQALRIVPIPSFGQGLIQLLMFAIERLDAIEQIEVLHSFVLPLTAPYAEDDFRALTSSTPDELTGDPSFFFSIHDEFFEIWRLTLDSVEAQSEGAAASTILRPLAISLATVWRPTLHPYWHARIPSMLVWEQADRSLRLLLFTIRSELSSAKRVGQLDALAGCLLGLYQDRDGQERTLQSISFIARRADRPDFTSLIQGAALDVRDWQHLSASIGFTVPNPSARDSDHDTPETREISAWISERRHAPDKPLYVDRMYTLNFKIGSTEQSNIIDSEERYIYDSNVPTEGLDTAWSVTSGDVILLSPSGDSRIKANSSGVVRSWTARFDLHLPKVGETNVRSLSIIPLHASTAELDVHIFSKGELFRQFLVELSIAPLQAEEESDGTPAVAVKDDSVITLSKELGLQLRNVWEIPPGKLQVIVSGDERAYVLGSIFLNGEELEVDDSTVWHTPQTSLNGPIENVRRAAERFREDSEDYLNDIDPNDLAARLKDFQPLRDWAEGLNRADQLADARHSQAWDQVQQSDQLRELAAEGYALYQRLFPRGSDLRGWLDDLPPGHHLEIRWTQKERVGVSSIPWSLVYMADPDDPIDPFQFMGLRFRLSHWKYSGSPSSKALGDPSKTYRAHLLYWGEAPNDVAAVEAIRQRTLWAELAPQVIVGPAVDAAPKDRLLQLLRTPSPAPMTVLYFFCHCDVGGGNDVVLRFGGTRDRRDIIRQMELPTRPFENGPLVFANACTTAASDPTIANELETRFFERGCRAFIGTETKVPVGFASRFASIFFHFFYRRVSSAPISAGEALAQARLFLWTHHKNIGGIFYSYINRYDLFLASNEELKAPRG